MNNSESIQIIERFFKVIDVLVLTKEIRGIKTFTDRYNIDRRNFYQIRKQPEKDMFQMAWLAHLINDFGVSAQWLMTGNGEMFVRKKTIKAD